MGTYDIFSSNKSDIFKSIIFRIILLAFLQQFSNVKYLYYLSFWYLNESESTLN